MFDYLTIYKSANYNFIKRYIIAILQVYFTVSIVSCSTPPDKIGKLNLQQWRSDRGGCKEIRKKQVEDFKSIENQLLGMHIDQVGAWMGRPDIHQLGSRDQKFYIYFVEKGIHCQDIKQKSPAQKVVLRFNAVGLLSEITFQAGFL